MKNMEIIHLNWEEYDWNDGFEQFNEKKHYGIYQVYGDHPVYGENALLYIGKAREQTYSARLSQHDDFIYTHLSTFRRLHLSYFLKSDDINYDNWGESIDLVEKVLINSHCPAYNAQDVKGILDDKTIGKDVLILNWGARGKLLPEVSSLRYSYYYWNKVDIDKVLK